MKTKNRDVVGFLDVFVGFGFSIDPKPAVVLYPSSLSRGLCSGVTMMLRPAGAVTVRSYIVIGPRVVVWTLFYIMALYVYAFLVVVIY